MQAGKLIRAWRIRKGLRQVDAAEQLGVNQGVLSRWENGTFTPHSRSILRIAEVTRIPVAKLLAD